MNTTQFEVNRPTTPLSHLALRDAIADLNGKLARWSQSVEAMRRTSTIPVGFISAAPQPTDRQPVPVVSMTQAAVVESLSVAGAADTDTNAAMPVAPAAVDDDEAVLASLEPEVANALRIKRRLLGRRVSARELLTDYQLRPPKTATSRSVGRSWFGWGNA